MSLGIDRSTPHAIIATRSKSLDEDILLPFGERDDGAVVHIADVPRGLACKCRCCGCGGRLVARKGSIKEHHFAHHGSAPCARALESALHKLAKQILNEELVLLLPEIAASRAGERLVESEQRLFRFDRAELEVRHDGFQPDVVLHRGDRRLLVEIFVTHVTDEVKQERIAQSGMAAVEIDLSSVSRSADVATIAAALCQSAPRWWISNRRIEVAKEKLEAQLAEKARRAAEAADRARRQDERRLEGIAARVSRAIGETGIKDAMTAPLRRVCDAGLEDVIGLEIPGDACFAVSRRTWQAAVVEDVVLSALSSDRWSQTGRHTSETFKRSKIAEMVRRGIPTFVSAADQMALSRQVPGFQSPYQVVDHFLTELARGGLIEARRKRWHVTDAAWQRVGRHREQEQLLAHRREQLLSTVRHIIDSLPPEEGRAFVLADWLTGHQSALGTTPAAAIKLEREGAALLSAVTKLKLMLLASGNAVDETVGLPVLAACLRERKRRDDEIIRAADARQAAQQAAAAAQRLADQRAAEHRLSQLRQSARLGLGAGADTWLLTPLESKAQRPPLHLAEAGDAELSAALAELARLVDQRREQAHLERLRERLRGFASASSKPDHGHVFLHSSHPRCRGMRPIDYCKDDGTFETVRKLLSEVVK